MNRWRMLARSLTLVLLILIFFLAIVGCCQAYDRINEQDEIDGLEFINENGYSAGDVSVWHDSVNNVCYIQEGIGHGQTMAPWLKEDGTPMIWGVDWPR